MNIYQVTYRTRLEGWEKTIQILAESTRDAFLQVSTAPSRPIPLRIFPCNEVDYVK